MMHVAFTVNGSRHSLEVEPRRTLADALREDLGLTGTHLGCEHGVCGACTVLVDGEPARACLMFAVQAESSSITTVEGMAGDDGTLHPLQKAFCRYHGLQCGFCTSGMLMSALDLLHREADPDRERIREELSGNICRCTGYTGIVDAVQSAAADMNAQTTPTGCGDIMGDAEMPSDRTADEPTAGAEIDNRSCERS